MCTAPPAAAACDCGAERRPPTRQVSAGAVRSGGRVGERSEGSEGNLQVE
jgi:hypothetical protein